MAETSVMRVLVRHFFRRFFDNDTVQPDADTTTTVVRAAAFVAAPGLIVAFFMQLMYPGRPAWGAVEDHYIFVLLAFVVMGVVAIFEWEMLFPDRLDFLVLSSLSLRPVQIVAAKAMALAGFLLIFLVSCTVFGNVLLPMVSHDHFFRQVLAHAVATGMAGAFAALLVVAVGGVLLCVLDARRFRMVSPVMQMAGVMAMLLLLVQFAEFGDAMPRVLAGGLGSARWLPTVWFLGVYEWVLRGPAAQAFAREAAWMAVRAMLVVAAVVGVTYPLAWVRMRKFAMEGGAGSRRAPVAWVAALVHGMVRKPGQRAVFHFVGQTMRRGNRYQVYLAMYCGTGLAIAVACVLSIGERGVEVSQNGLHALTPLLLFWVVGGLRAAFGFPMNLSAGWVFRVTGVEQRQTAEAERRWVMAAAMGALAGILGLLAAAGWGMRALAVQVVCGVCIASVLTDGFFLLLKNVPFNRKRMPGRTSLPLMLTMYIGVFPVFVSWMVGMEVGIEQRMGRMVWPVLVAVVVRAGAEWLRGRFEEVEEEMEGYEGEFQLLNLS